MSRKRPSADDDFLPASSSSSKKIRPTPSSPKRKLAPKPLPTVGMTGAGGPGSRPMSKEAIRKANHSMIERRRREKMNGCFSELRGMIPGLGGGSEDGKGMGGGEFKLEVLERAVEYMKTLISRLDVLESQASPEPHPPTSHYSQHRASSSRSTSRGRASHSQTHRRGSGGGRGKSRSVKYDEEDEDEAEEEEEEDEDEEEEREEEGDEEDVEMEGADREDDDAYEPPRGGGGSTKTASRDGRQHHHQSQHHSYDESSSSPWAAQQPSYSSSTHTITRKPSTTNPPSRSPTSSIRSNLHTSPPPSNSIKPEPFSPPLADARPSGSDSEATLPEEGLPREGEVHPLARNHGSLARSRPIAPSFHQHHSDRRAGSSSTNSGSHTSSPSFERLGTNPSPPTGGPNPQSILAAVGHPSRGLNSRSPPDGMPFSRFVHPNLPSPSSLSSSSFGGNGAFGSVGGVTSTFGASSLSSLQQIRNPNIYLPPPLTSASPTSPFFNPMDYGSGRGIVEPSPLLAPLQGLGSLFPGMGRMDSMSSINGTSGNGAGAGGEEGEQTPSMAAKVDGIISSGTSNGSAPSNVTEISPFLDPSPATAAHHTFEEKAANILLSFASPEVTARDQGRVSVGGLEKWSLDGSVAAVRRSSLENVTSGERKVSAGGDKEGKVAKTARDILNMSG